ncbi:RHS repeat-associated core domain-containing protein [Kallotenue papyrolyticum]|uniref:RHS repeat-associated core domain-containing protein n=1 Tax=Kallotenue papyrolyticum TaxID=1325125 RepID=UPI001267D0F7|nr:RHS repeat-associated core domain-containing protein [Kallotenue papyrolyticum]
MSLATNASGAVVCRQDFDPWGSIRSGGISQTTLNYTGQRRDGTGLLYYHARYYDPVLGRFISADTIVPGSGALTLWPSDATAAPLFGQQNAPGPQNPQELNRYSYVNNNPIRHTDPTGHCTAAVIDCPIIGPGLVGTAICGPGCGLIAAGGALVGVVVIYGATSESAPLTAADTVGSSGEFAGVYTLSDGSAQKKRGPKPKGTGPHNEKVEERIKDLKGELGKDWEHTHGGTKKEEYIETPGGTKNARRPDITYKNKKTGEVHRENVGKTYKDGRPVKRETDALNDIERATGKRPKFTPYDR